MASWTENEQAWSVPLGLAELTLAEGELGHPVSVRSATVPIPITIAVFFFISTPFCGADQHPERGDAEDFTASSEVLTPRPWMSRQGW